MATAELHDLAKRFAPMAKLTKSIDWPACGNGKGETKKNTAPLV